MRSLFAGGSIVAIAVLERTYAVGTLTVRQVKCAVSKGVWWGLFATEARARARLRRAFLACFQVGLPRQLVAGCMGQMMYAN